MPTQINAVNCKKFIKGTGLISCEPFFGEITSAFLTSKSWKLSLDDAEDFDLDYVISKVQDGTFIPLLQKEEFTENTGEPTRKDFSGGKRRTIRNANPDYTLEFDNGIAYHGNVYTLNDGSWNVFFVDNSGNVQIQRNVAGTAIMGFDADDVNVRTYRQQQGDNSAGTLVDIHLADPEAFNRQMVMISRDEINANLNSEVLGVVSVEMTVVSATATSVVVDVKASNNTKYGIEALEATNFEIYNGTDDAVATVSTATASTTVLGRYTLSTFSPTLATSDVIQVQNKGYSLGQSTLIADTAQLYKGQSPEFTVTA